MKKIICIMGETGSGKDSIMKYISKELGIKEIVSYATRPRRNYETDGKEHYFISQGEMELIKKEGRMLAYVKLGENGYEYCTTPSCLVDDTMLYIIDPDGIKNMIANEKNMKDIELFVIYIYVPYNERRLRVEKSRGNLDEFNKRVENEQCIFDRARKNKEYDVLIKNDDFDTACREAVESVRRFIG